MADELVKIYELYRAALERPADRRAVFLQLACADDNELLRNVEALLARTEQDAETPGNATPTVAVTAPRDAGHVGSTGAGDAPPTMGANDETIRSPERARPPTSVVAELGPNDLPGYERVRILSQGGQGVVYRARQLGTNREVAVKFLRPGAASAPSNVRRFEREIELAGRLSHPNIVSIFHSGTTPDGRRYYVMDFVKGAPLHRYVGERRCSLEDTLELFARVCDGVQFAHQHGIIHRDLKPSNILVNQQGRPKVLDFGLARPLHESVDQQLTLSHELMGTLPYMAPEQTRGGLEDVDTRSDVYSLGVILYELLTGGFPYPVVGHLVDVLRHIIESQPTPPSQRWSRDKGVSRRSSGRLRSRTCPIDHDVQTMILKALAKEPARRYQSAGEFGRDLRCYLRGEPIEAKRASFWYVLRKITRRNLGQTIAAASVLVILGSAATIVLDYARVAKRRQAALQESQQVVSRELAQQQAFAAEYRQGALAWFLVEWWADRPGSAGRCAEMVALAAPGSPEYAVMAFLLDDRIPLERLLLKVGEANEMLAYFALGERCLRNGQTTEAREAYQHALSADPPERWRLLMKARLNQMDE